VATQRSHFVRARLLFVAGVLGALASNVWPAVRLTGVVVDQMGAVIPETSVTLFSADRIREAKTDEMGQFEFASIPRGVFDLKAEHRGFVVRVIEDIRAEEGGDQHLSIMLNVAATSSCGLGEPTIDYAVRHGTVNLTGSIADFWDGPLGGINDTVTNLKSQKTLVVTTNKNGQFQLANLEPGKYTLNANQDGYSERSKVAFWITAANLTSLGPVYVLRKNESRLIICQ